jgi:excisionase family DNA binding protein
LPVHRARRRSQRDENTGRAPLDPDEEHDTYLMVREVAALMRVSKMTVYRLIEEKELDAKRFGWSYRIPEKAVDKYLIQAAI